MIYLLKLLFLFLLIFSILINFPRFGSVWPSWDILPPCEFHTDLGQQRRETKLIVNEPMRSAHNTTSSFYPWRRPLGKQWELSWALTPSVPYFLQAAIMSPPPMTVAISYWFGFPVKSRLHFPPILFLVDWKSLIPLVNQQLGLSSFVPVAAFAFSF